jgi:hypothetical protein
VWSCKRINYETETTVYRNISQISKHKQQLQFLYIFMCVCVCVPIAKRRAMTMIAMIDILTEECLTAICFTSMIFCDGSVGEFFLSVQYTFYISWEVQQGFHIFNYIPCNNYIGIFTVSKYSLISILYDLISHTIAILEKFLHYIYDWFSC